MARPANPELRGKILRAAADIVESCGPDCVTMREVAEKVGYSSTTLYLYFKDKNAILKESVLNAFDELNESCRLAMVGPSALDKYRQRCRAYVIWGLTHPGHYTLMFQLPWEMDWSVQFTEETFGRLTQGRKEDLIVLREALDGGELATGVDLEALEDSVWAALHGATSLAISGRLTGASTDAGPAEKVAVTTRISDDLVNSLIACRLP
ncbi:MAG TPA: TetR/AcrR family transcriptional regulator [Coriobacteriia bacterium]|nr:TetR/AcrR family transcriptional regulator [Coriobacteriia bacterium]